MGVLFLEHLGGHQVLRCNYCQNYLTNRSFLVSTRFTSSHGPAWLFSKVVNVFSGEAVPRNLVTGRHMVRDVYCKKCLRRLGWFYEMAYGRSQRYKEGCTILEIEQLVEELDNLADYDEAQYLVM